MKILIKNNVYHVGYIDNEMKHFHGLDYPTQNGSTQNAYLIQEEKTVLIDTVLGNHKDYFVKNLESEIDLKKIDYIILNHSETDHSGALVELMKKIPNTPIYCTRACERAIKGQYGDFGWKFNNVKTGDTLSIGNNKELVFIEMQMVHWPDSMATYLTKDNILFSNDAFGQHVATDKLFDFENKKELIFEEALKYYVNIVHAKSNMVKRKLDLVKEFSQKNKIDIIATSHGIVWKKEINKILKEYEKWVSGEYAENQITIVYDTMWGETEKLAEMIKKYIKKESPKTKVKVLNISQTDKITISTEIFKSKAFLIGSSTITNTILSSVAGFLHYLNSLKMQNKKAISFGCYGWSGESTKMVFEKLSAMGFDVVGELACQWKAELKDDFKTVIKKILK